MKVNEETMKVLGKELSWAPKLFPKEVTRFQVTLIDLDTLSLRPQWNSIQPSMFIIDGAGRVIGEVGAEWRMVKKFFGGSQSKRVVFKETVEEAVKRLSRKAPRDIRFIFEMRDVVSVHIYKLPNRIPNLRAWLDQKVTEAQDELKKTLNG